MNGCRNSAVAIALLFLVLCTGCGEIRSVADALNAIDTKPSRTGKAEKYLLTLDDDTRLKLGLELFVADSPARGHVGIRLLASIQINAETWRGIESRLTAPHIARRFSILSRKVGRTDSVAVIISFLQISPAGDLVVHTSALADLTGLSFSQPTVPQALVAARWARYAQRERDGIARIVSQALAGSYTAKDADSSLRSFCLIPVGMLGVIADDILDITDNVYFEVGREAALLLGDSTDDASARLLFVLLDSDDFLTRYNAYNSLVKRTGISFAYDPASTGEARRKALDSARLTLGIPE